MVEKVADRAFDSISKVVTLYLVDPDPQTPSMTGNESLALPSPHMPILQFSNCLGGKDSRWVSKGEETRPLGGLFDHFGSDRLAVKLHMETYGGIKKKPSPCMDIS